MAYVDLSEPPKSVGSSKVDFIIKKWRESEILKEQWKPKYEEAYEYTMPQRESFYDETPAERRTDKIFDETAVVGIQEFASRLQSGIVPTFARWANLEAGTDIPDEAQEEVNVQLDSITKYIFELLGSSNFNQEVHETFMDLAVGTGVLMVEEGDAVNPINFTAVPLSQVSLLNGPNNKVDTIFRKRVCKFGQVSILYPQAKISEETMQQMDEDKKCVLIDGVYRDYTDLNEEKYKRCVMLLDRKEIIFEQEYVGVGSNPYIVFRWNKASGEVYGRGPVFNAMSAIKTCNLTIQLILETAQLAVSGIYQIEDDGVVNPDNISLVPGTLIPIAPASRGLMPIEASGRFDVAQLILEDMRNNIKKALYMETLGRPEGTPMTATEVAERMADLSRQIGSSFGRLQAEFVLPVLRRVIRLLVKQGRIDIPMVNGRDIKVQAVSPLSRAQFNQDITDINRFNEIIGVTFGPQMLNLIVNQDELARHLAKLMNIPEKILRDKAEQQQMANEISQMAQQGQAEVSPNEQAQ